jgi:hypothetical protein
MQKPSADCLAVLLNINLHQCTTVDVHKLRIRKSAMYTDGSAKIQQENSAT